MKSIACLILLALVSIVSAAPSNVMTVPYNISFDPGTTRNYTVEVMSPLEDKNYTAYTVLIDVPNVTGAGIYIADLKTPEDATIATIESMYKYATRGMENASVGVAKIDGKDGIIASYIDQRNRRVFEVKYWLDSMSCDCGPLSAGSKEVRLIGTMPQNSEEGMEITRSLIDTLHIEKIASQAAKTVPLAVRPEPYILVHDQSVVDNHGNAIIDDAFSDGPGWLVINNDKYDPFSNLPTNSPMGYTHLNDGLNKNVKVKLNMAYVTPKLYAVLFKDRGQVGTFEYPGVDYPIYLNPNAEAIYSFYSTLNHPLADLQIDWRQQMSFPGTDWL
jgi:hypothetical protein